MRPPERGGWGCDAAWADDFHHALHVALTGETDGWYEEFARPRHAGQGVPPPARPRRHVLDVPRPPVRRARRGRRARALRRLLVRPRPGRQPRVRRPPAAGGATARRAAHVSGTVHADAVPGRGVRRGRAVPVLLRPHRRGHRDRDPRGAAARVRRVRRVRPRECPTRRTRRRSRRSKLTRAGEPAGLRELYAAALALRARAGRRRRRGASATAAGSPCGAGRTGSSPTSATTPWPLDGEPVLVAGELRDGALAPLAGAVVR